MGVRVSRISVKIKINQSPKYIQGHPTNTDPLVRHKIQELEIYIAIGMQKYKKNENY